MKKRLSERASILWDHILLVCDASTFVSSLFFPLWAFLSLPLPFLLLLLTSVRFQKRLREEVSAATGGGQETRKEKKNIPPLFPACGFWKLYFSLLFGGLFCPERGFFSSNLLEEQRKREREKNQDGGECSSSRKTIEERERDASSLLSSPSPSPVMYEIKFSLMRSLPFFSFPLFFLLFPPSTSRLLHLMRTHKKDKYLTSTLAFFISSH